MTPRARHLLRFWIPVLIWMALIFSASTDFLSGDRTSRFLDPLLRWLLPNASDDAIGQGVLLIRKAAHVTEYGVFAALLWRAWRFAPPFRREVDDRAAALLAIGTAAVYAATDELHQAFTASRFGSVVDVGIDVAGAAMALGLVVAVRSFWRSRVETKGSGG